MKKRIALVLGAASLLGAVAVGAHAETVTVPGVGYITADSSGEVTANGENGNGPGASGYVTVRRDTQNVCADDNGDPGASDSPTCLPG